MMDLLLFAYEVVGALIFVYIITFLWFQYKFKYWYKKCVVGPQPTFPFGNIRDVVRRRVQLFQPYCDNYFKYKHLPYVGMFSFAEPVLSINDLDIARHVLIKDFEHFQAHGIFSGGSGDPLAGHLFNMHGPRWKNIRSKMSPTFTNGKLKTMYPLIENIADDALNYVEWLSSKEEDVNFTEFYAKYVMEIIGSVGFGVDFKGINSVNSEFFIRGHEYFEPRNLYWTFMRSLAFFAPNFFKKLSLRRINPEIINFFYRLVKNTVKYREENSYKRNDFLQTLIDLKNGRITDENGLVLDTNKFSFSMTDVAANTMLYMYAGYETSATTGQFAAYELAVNPDVQTRARTEVLSILAKHGGRCTFEAQSEMTYLNMVLDETMRKHPPMRALFRRCTKDYKLPNSDLVIETGTLIFVPVQAIQMDPDIFPEPERFDPERFTPDKKAKMHPCHWMPFGEGPRKCLGLRQGYIQSKLALIKILQHYELSLADRTQVPLRVKASSLANTAEGDIWLKLTKLQK